MGLSKRLQGGCVTAGDVKEKTDHYTRVCHLPLRLFTCGILKRLTASAVSLYQLFESFYASLFNQPKKDAN